MSYRTTFTYDAAKEIEDAREAKKNNSQTIYICVDAEANDGTRTHRMYETAKTTTRTTAATETT